MKATNEFGRDLDTWDDGCDEDPIFVYGDSLGPVGVIRAATWETAWEHVRPRCGRRMVGTMALDVWVIRVRIR